MLCHCALNERVNRCSTDLWRSFRAQPIPPLTQRVVLG